ncbi:hypothetical protein E3Q01_03137 [Wallemia mellicola]|uniref:PCI domain-containing protein n=1 Tax=Wallemia mellicola TaxID=1708541 RepID=A0A4T0THQ7_9BASI|nr:hypothetical protein E3Q05_02923 [Wallemia mellicola]TIC63767.1 hypothetical protein E3Q01_03137 [Wallemia mellicola]
MNYSFATDSSYEEHIQEIVGFLSRQLAENDKNNFIEIYQNKLIDLNQDKKVEILDSLLLDIKGLGLGSWSEIEGFFNLVGYLIVDLFEKSKVETTYKELINKLAITNSIDKKLLLYKVIYNLINNLSQEYSELRLESYKQLLELSIKNNDLQFVLQDYNLVSDLNDPHFFLTISNYYDQTNLNKESLDYLIKYLSFNENDNNQSKLLIKKVLEDKENFNLAQLLELKAIINVEQSTEFNLLSSIIKLNDDQFNKSIDQLDIDKEVVNHKYLLIKLNNYCSNFIGKDIAYDDISTNFRIEINRVELLLIELIKSGLTIARLNQSTKTFKVSHSNKLMIEQQDWLNIKTNLINIKSNLNKILNVL